MKNIYIKRLSINYISQSIIRRLEKLNGLDFLATVKSSDNGLDPRIMYSSSPTDRKFLKKVLEKLNINDNDKILDIGCGKGNAILIMLKFPFSQVDGIEISQDLIVIAKSNFQKLKVTNIKLYNIDASEFKYFDIYNYVYFFNPFHSSIMQKVLENLIDSINRKPRKVTIIYFNPECHQEIINTKVFFKISGFRYKNKDPMWIYSNIVNV